MAEVAAVVCGRCMKVFAQDASNKSTPAVCEACKIAYAQRKVGGGRTCMRCGSLITDENAYVATFQKLFATDRLSFWLCETCYNAAATQAPDGSPITLGKMQAVPQDGEKEE